MSRYDYEIDEKTGKRRPAHCLIWERYHKQTIPDGYDIHHIDGNGHNNNPKNLRLISHAEHIALHHALRRHSVDPVDASNEEVVTNRNYHKTYYERNKAKHKAYKKQYLEENKEKVALSRHLYYKRNYETIAEKRKIYKAKNAEKIREANKRYREAHKEERAEYNKKYDAEHAEQRSIKAHERYLANKEKIRSVHAEYRASHADERKVYNQQYREQHRELIRAKGRLYMAKRRGASSELLSQYKAEVDQLSRTN